MPGVTAGVAATAYAGIPVTHRDDASAVAFVTGHEDPEKDETALDWEALARFPGTLVFYMGVKRLAENAAALIAAGRDPDEPAAAVERGTMSGQRTVTATLGALAEAVEREGIGAPALIVVGEVVERREALAWLERRPLHGRGVVVTRARAQASGLAPTLRELGAEVIELPAIRIEPRIETDEVRRAVERDRRLRPRLPDQPQRRPSAVRGVGGRGPRRPGACRRNRRRDRAGDSGGARRARDRRRRRPRALRRRGAGRGAWRASRSRAAGSSSPAPPRRATCFPTALRERGAEVDDVALYETVREEPEPEAVEAAQDADYVTFTSSSTVRNLTEALGERFPGGARVVSIGPITSEAARDAGPHGRRRGRAPRHRRPARGAARRRRPMTTRALRSLFVPLCDSSSELEARQ